MKFKCPKCGNTEHFVAMAMLPITMAGDRIVDTYEDQRDRVTIDASQVICIPCSDEDAFPGDKDAVRAFKADQPGEPCRKCGSLLDNDGYCTDATCPYESWPQRVYLGDLHSMTTREVEDKWNVQKRQDPEPEVTITESEYHLAQAEGHGWCTMCDGIVGHLDGSRVEPDAEGEDCPLCGCPSMYGVDYALDNGLVGQCAD